MIIFTPLSGSAVSSSTPRPYAHLLQIDDVRVLLDCGSPDWRLGGGEKVDGQEDEIEPVERQMWEEYLDLLERNARAIDLVLLTHGSLPHLGLYAYARARLGLRAPAYATLPVQALGRLAVLEDVEGWRSEVDVEQEAKEELPDDEQIDQNEGAVVQHGTGLVKGRRKGIATVEEVNEAFESITTLKYSQATHLTGKLQSLTLTAFSASHTLGGTLWKLRSAASGTLLYAVSLNHLKEHHLDGTVLVRPAGAGVGEGLGRPDLLVTDAERMGVVSVRRREREEAFLDAITRTLLSSNSVLIPVDASTRVLELLIILDQHWGQLKLKAPLCLVSRTGRECMTFVRSLMEWMGGWVAREGAEGVPAPVGKENKGGKRRHRRGRGRDEPEEDEDEEALLAAVALRFKHLTIFPTPQALLAAIPSSTPKVVLATPPTISHGASRMLFQGFASSPGDLVLLVSRAEQGTLSRKLWERWEKDQPPAAKWGTGGVGELVRAGGKMRMTMNAKVPLQGAELEAHLAAERAAKEKEAAAAAAAARAQRLLEADDDDEADSDEEGSDAASEEMEVEAELGRATGEGALAMPFAEGGIAASKAGPGEGPEADEIDSARQQLSFDIYLKGNVSRATSFFKVASGAQATRYRMFPYVEKRRRVDSYGEAVDIGTWMRKGKKWEEEEEQGDTREERERKRRKVEEEEGKKAPVEPPSKFVTEEVVVDLQCTLFFVDFEALNDGRATKMILPQVNPRKMILVGAEPSASSELVESCDQIKIMTKEIFTPAVGEPVRIGEHSHSFSISLGDELLASLQMSRFEDHEVAHVSGRIVFHANSAIPILEPAAAIAQPNAAPSLPAIKAEHPRGGLAPLAALTLPRSTLIGDLRLTALKARLSTLGIIADFAGDGMLICGLRKEGNDSDVVAVRKMESGRVEVEGTVNEVYYTVRKELYGLHAQVAG